MARILLVIPLVVIGVVAIVAGIQSLGDDPDVIEGSDPGPEPGGARVVVIRIENDRFKPEDVSLTVGETVRWSNADDSAHRVMSAPGAEASFRSPRIAPGDDFEHTFTEIGPQPYRGDVQPRMRGEVTVFDN